MTHDWTDLTSNSDGCIFYFALFSYFVAFCYTHVEYFCKFLNLITKKTQFLVPHSEYIISLKSCKTAVVTIYLSNRNFHRKNQTILEKIKNKTQLSFCFRIRHMDQFSTDTQQLPWIRSFSRINEIRKRLKFIQYKCTKEENETNRAIEM